MNFKLIRAVLVCLTASMTLFSQSIQNKQVERVLENLNQSTNPSDVIRQLNNAGKDPLMIELENILDEGQSKTDNSGMAEKTIKDINEIQSLSKSLNDSNEESSEEEINSDEDDSIENESGLNKEQLVSRSPDKIFWIFNFYD